ncbi:MAG: flagellar biosynthetic protein FliO [Devosia sp.]|nr:flagellar biosynthetic protein FliO [Devosia sp.]
MQFLTSLLGGSGDTIVTSALALGIVLVLIVLGLWVLKLVMRSGVSVRIRGRRIGVIEQVQVDAKRQLLIVRRDNVEHLILTGGPQDLLIEAGIPVDKSVQPLRRPLGTAAEDGASSTPADETEHVSPPKALRPHIERLKEFARPMAGKPRSLRHTGLLRPVSVMEPAVIPMSPMTGDNSGRGKADSATTPAGMDGNGRTGFGPQRTFGDTGTGDI